MPAAQSQEARLLGARRWSAQGRECGGAGELHERHKQDKSESNAIERGVTRDRDNSVGDWVFQISHETHFEIDGRDPPLILVDSGCHHQSCPPWFAPHVATVATEKQHGSTANKQPLTHYGKKIVLGWLVDAHGHRACDVKRPVLSTMMLAKQEVYLQHHPEQLVITKPRRSIVMTESNGLPFLQFYPGEADALPVEMEDQQDHTMNKDTELYDGTGGGMTSEGDVRKARGILIPPGPSPAIRRLHELTHMPERSWCQSWWQGEATKAPISNAALIRRLYGQLSRPTTRSYTRPATRATR